MEQFIAKALAEWEGNGAELNTWGKNPFSHKALEIYFLNFLLVLLDISFYEFDDARKNHCWIFINENVISLSG